MKVLATTDGSNFSRAALRELSKFLPTKGTEVLLLSAYPGPLTGPLGMMGPPYVDYEALAKQIVKETQSTLAEGEEILRNQGFQVRSISREGDAAPTILDVAHHELVDLIVVGSHGRTGLSRFLLGSVSAQVMAHATCSVLVVKTPFPEADEPGSQRV